MRVRPVLQALSVIFAMGVLSSNHVLASTATLQPVAGVVVTNAGGIARVAGGIVAGGYVLTAASLEFLGGATVYVGWRIAGAGAVAAAAGATVGPLILAGLTLGAGAAYMNDWLNSAQAQGLAGDFVFDPATGRILRRGVPGSGVDQDATLTIDGRSLNQAISEVSNLEANCANGCTSRVRPPGSYGCTTQGFEIVNYLGNRLAGWCLSAAGVVLPPAGPDSTPTPDEWSRLAADLAALPTPPRLLPAYGIPVPVEPVPVLNPPISPGAESPPIGATNPSAIAPSQPIRVADGEPIPIPNTVPAQYTQPWQEVTGVGTPTQPWLVNIAPVTTVVNDPTAPTVPITPPLNPPLPANPTGPFYTDCEKYPTSLGCMPVGTPPPDATIPTRTLDITQQTGPTFGGGGCPANLNFNLHGQQITGINMATPCSWITSYVKPIILLLAAISAVFIVLPRAET